MPLNCNRRIIDAAGVARSCYIVASVVLDEAERFLNPSESEMYHKRGECVSHPPSSSGASL